MPNEHYSTLLQRYVDDCRRIAGPALGAVFLFGESTTPGWTGGTKALTTAVVVNNITMALLRAIGDLTTAWTKRGLPPPLLLEESALARSCDVFPLEILALQDTREMLWGERDPVAALSVDAERLRAQVEQQLRGKLLHLRQAYLEVHGRRRELRCLLLDSSAGFETIARGLLHLAGRERPATSEALLQALAEETGLDLSTFRQVRAAALGAGLALGRVDATFEMYHDELAALARTVDRMQRP